MSIKAGNGAVLLAQLEAPSIRSLWDEGHDTAEIAKQLKLKEHAVYGVVVRLQNERHAARKQMEARS